MQLHIDALLHVRGDRPGVQIRVYLDGQEYTSRGTYQMQLAKIQECIDAAEDAAALRDCHDKGLHLGYALHEAGVPLRYKSYSYRWHYSTAVQMHHKYIVVDGDRVASGSYNISPNAEFDTFENLVFYDRDLFPGVVDGFVGNFESLWTTGAGALPGVLADVQDGSGDVPLAWESMALTWQELTDLKQAVRTACPPVDESEYREDRRRTVCTP